MLRGDFVLVPVLWIVGLGLVIQCMRLVILCSCSLQSHAIAGAPYVIRLIKLNELDFNQCVDGQI